MEGNDGERRGDGKEMEEMEEMGRAGSWGIEILNGFRDLGLPIASLGMQALQVQ